MFALQIIFLGVFFIKRLKPIENFLLSPDRLQIKFNQANPPKKDEEKKDVKKVKALKLRSKSIKIQNLNNFNNHQNANFKIEEYNTKDTNNNSHNINNNLKLIAQPEAVKRLRTRNNKSLSISQI